MSRSHLIKLHLNEHISPRLAEQLRKHGFDVTFTQDAILLSKPITSVTFCFCGRNEKSYSLA